MPNEFTKLVTRHTIAYSLVVGVIVAVVLLGIYRLEAILGVAGGALFALGNWVVWRPGGLGRRIEKDIPDGPIDVKTILQAIGLAVLFAIPAFLVIWLLN